VYAKYSNAKGHPKIAIAEPPKKSMKKDVLLIKILLPLEIKNKIIQAIQLNNPPIKYITKKVAADMLVYIQ
jgi:hypothetical protein